MKIVDRATIKLTAVYTAAIMTISLGFSLAIGMIAISEVRRPFKVPSTFIELRMSDAFTRAYDAQADQVESKVWFSLAMININVFIVAIASSYVFARWTLKPIEKAMDDESQFVSDASHELRTPLATMRMENEITLRDDEATKADYKRQIKSNLEEIDKLRQLTDTLLRLSSSAQVKASTAMTGDIVASAIDRIGRAAEAKNIAIDDKVKDDKIQTNADALSEIVYIYLDNAIKYSPKDSTIEISGDGKSISVRDYGDGIADKDLPNIFNRFYRADKSRNSDGFGLGLSLAQRLAEQLGAKVSAKNNSDGKGATFTVTL